MKTPGLSQIKTRLAEAIGESQAVTFHRLSAKAVASVVRKIQGGKEELRVFWAVAEEAGMHASEWSEFGRIHQGHGSLNERLHHIYHVLQSRYRSVILLGADSPHISPILLQEACALLNDRSTSFILGRSWDGGFYLFGGNVPIPKEIWHEMPCSHPRTAETLFRMLKNLGKVRELPSTFDVDFFEDLERLNAAFRLSPFLTSEQKEVFKWLENGGALK